MIKVKLVSEPQIKANLINEPQIKANILATQISGSGTSDHSQLTSLDYTSSGHIGFASSNQIDIINEHIDEITVTAMTNLEIEALLT